MRAAFLGFFIVSFVLIYGYIILHAFDIDELIVRIGNRLKRRS